MKVLISEMEALKGYVSSEWHHVMRVLVDDYGWINLDRRRLWAQAGSLDEKLRRRLGRLPDSLFLWGGFDFAADHHLALARMDCQKGFFIEDLHKQARNEHALTQSVAEICDVILAAYADRLRVFYPDIPQDKRIVWIPHSSAPHFQLELNEAARDSILLSGAVNDAYPMRQQMKTLSDDPANRIVYHPHPGYRRVYNQGTDPGVGRSYAAMINQHRVGFTDGSKYNYLVAKHFEIPAAGALLMADRSLSPALQQFGFVQNEHYISVSAEDLQAKIAFVLDEAHRPDLDRIRRRGQDLVWQFHTTDKRAKLIDDAFATP